MQELDYLIAINVAPHISDYFQQHQLLTLRFGGGKLCYFFTI
jgi:hypothetical protein